MAASCPTTRTAVLPCLCSSRDTTCDSSSKRWRTCIFRGGVVGRLAEDAAHAPISPCAGDSVFRVVHRDIKPGNLLVSQHTLKVTDFGVSHVFESSGEDLLRSTVGTAAFQAPEMCTGGTFSGRKADLWCGGMGVALPRVTAPLHCRFDL